MRLFRGGLPFRLLSGLALGLLGGLPLGLSAASRLGIFSRLPLGFLGGFAARFFFALATDFRLTSRFRFLFGPRQFSLPFRFLALAAALFLRLPFQFFPDGGFVHYLRLDRFDFILFGMRRRPDRFKFSNKNTPTTVCTTMVTTVATIS